MRVADKQGDRANIPDQCAESLAERLRAVTRLNVAMTAHANARTVAAITTPLAARCGTLARVGERRWGRPGGRRNGPCPTGVRTAKFTGTSREGHRAQRPVAGAGVAGVQAVHIATRLNKLETKIGLRGPCRVCGGHACLSIVVDTPDWPAGPREPEHCPGCGRPPMVIRIVPAVVPTPTGPEA
jgi:hypothetical protein